MLSTSPSQGVTGISDTVTGSITQTPIPVTVLADPTGLPVGTYSGTVSIATGGGQTIAIPVSLAITGNHLRIPQVADGASWKTTIVLVNNDSTPAPFTISFNGADGTPLSLPLESLGQVTTYSDTIAVGGSRTINSQGQANDLSQGWAEVVAGKSISGTTIFRQHLSDTADSEGAVPIQTGSGKHFLLAFDNTAGFVTSMAILNPDSSQGANVTVAFRDEHGQPITTKTLGLNAGNRQAIVLPSQFPEVANQRGVAEFTSSSVEGSAFGLRFNPLGAFTSIQPIVLDTLPPAGTTGTISQIADGGGWQTTMILVNTGSAPGALLNEIY